LINETTPKVLDSEKLPLWRKIGYGLGDIYGGGASLLVNFYYLIFLTDVVLINPGLAGTVILISKVYDALTDPFEGVLSDRTRTRWGRRKPYILAGIPLVFLSFFLLFFPVNFEIELHRFIFVVLTYLFFSTIVSIVMLNYNAVQSEMTLDYNERTSLTTWRILFSTIGSIFAAVLPLEIVKLTADTRQGYMIMAAIFGVIWAVPFIATFFSIQEREDFQKPPKKFDWREAFIDPWKVRTFVIALLMFLLSFTAIDMVSSIVVYFMKYHMMRGDETSFVNGTLLIAQVISLPFYAWLSKRTSKLTGFLVGCVIWMVVMLVGLLITPATPAVLTYIFAASVGFGTGGIVVMMYSIFPDIPDVDELQTGERREGIYAALRTTVRKLSSAIGLFVVGNAIAWAGYVEPVEEVINGATRLVEQPQSDTFILVLRLIFTFAPVILVGLAIWAAVKYPLSPEIHHRLNKLLAERRAGEPDTESRSVEAEEISKILIGGKSV
jgi:oligogalacturonide transporter